MINPAAPTKPAIKLFRPRLTDHFGIHKSQNDLDFAIQFLNEDIPLYVDPFLLWNSPSQQDQALHTCLINSFNHLNFLSKKGKEEEAATLLIALSECSEVGLGVSKTRTGLKISKQTAHEILGIFKSIPQYSEFGFTHFETIQLYVGGISKDRISDFTCGYLKSFLIDYTMDQCTKLGIPLAKVPVKNLYNYKRNRLEIDSEISLPVNPTSGTPLIFTPKRWLRFSPWINFEDYYKSHCPKDEKHNPAQTIDRVEVLNFNRDNYGIVEGYIEYKVRQNSDCKNDPLFSQIPVLSAKRKLGDILALPSGKEDGADTKYEEYSSELLASLFYPHLDFAEVQSRTETGCHIRDLVFYNNRAIDFQDEVFANYDNRQIVIEMKNVAEITRDHLNQLNRYLQNGFGRFGIFLTRKRLSKAMYKNTIDLWSSQRKCLIAITDEELKLMVEVYESKQRAPIEVLKKIFVEFHRNCPS